MTRFTQELSTCRVPASVAEWARRGTPRTTLIGPRFTRTAYGWYRRADRRRRRPNASWTLRTVCRTAR